MRFMEMFEGQVTGTYVSVEYDTDTCKNLASFAKQHSVPNPLPETDYHTTIVYSRKPIAWIPEIPNPEVTVEFAGWDVFTSPNGNDKCLVMLIKSDYLNERFDISMEMGATYDFPDYRPHITLSYNIGDFDIAGLPSPDFDLKFSHEHVEPIRAFANKKD